VSDKNILPIVAYGSPLLRKIAVEIDKDYPQLDELIDNMYATMEYASGVGLAAPQVNKSIRLFIVDASPFAEAEEDEEEPDEDILTLKDFQRVFINPEISDENGEEWGFEEGCLSIPNIRESVMRKPNLTVKYFDRNFNTQEEQLTGLAARIVQHEYDHLDGILFPDKINPLRRRLLTKKLMNITKGNVDVKYKMLFPSKKR
jgi:peptide deformylase